MYRFLVYRKDTGEDVTLDRNWFMRDDGELFRMDAGHLEHTGDEFVVRNVGENPSKPNEVEPPATIGLRHEKEALPYRGLRNVPPCFQKVKVVAPTIDAGSGFGDKVGELPSSIVTDAGINHLRNCIPDCTWQKVVYPGGMHYERCDKIVVRDLIDLCPACHGKVRIDSSLVLG